MNLKWLNPFIANLWAWLSACLVFWCVANASAFYRFAVLLERYRGKSPATPEEVVTAFGNTVGDHPEAMRALTGAARRPASATTLAGAGTEGSRGGAFVSPSVQVQEYLQNPEVDARAEDYRQILGTKVSPNLIACLVANLTTEEPQDEDVEASQAAMEAIRQNPSASLADLREAMARFGSTQGRNRERQLIFEIAHSLMVPPISEAEENRRTLEDMEAILIRGF